MAVALHFDTAGFAVFLSPKGGEEYQGVNLSSGCLKGFYFVSLSIVITCSAGAEGP